MNQLFLRVYVALRTSLLHRSPSRQRGQATTEYVLVLLGVAAIALVVAAWAARTGKISDLLDRVFDSVASDMG